MTHNSPLPVIQPFIRLVFKRVRTTQKSGRANSFHWQDAIHISPFYNRTSRARSYTRIHSKVRILFKGSANIKRAAANRESKRIPLRTPAQDSARSREFCVSYDGTAKQAPCWNQHEIHTHAYIYTRKQINCI